MHEHSRELGTSESFSCFLVGGICGAASIFGFGGFEMSDHDASYHAKFLGLVLAIIMGAILIASIWK
jgi:hypothetical protein